MANPQEAKPRIPGIEQQPELPKSKETARESESMVVPEVSAPKEAETPARPAPISQPVSPAPASKDTVLVEVETILSEGLGEIYKGLPDKVKPAFRAKGEETAKRIQEMVTGAKVKARHVLKLIIAWLKLIPGVNKFFLEQEAAIKTQKIVAMVKKK